MGPGVEAFLVYAVAALCSCAVSFVLGRHWPARRQLDEAWEDGYDVAVAEHDADMAARPQVTALAIDARQVTAEGEGRALHGLNHAQLAPGPDQAPIRGVGELTGPGRLPSQDTYRAELARIGRPDPAPWYQALTAPDPPVEPGPPAEPAWLERLLYKGAMSTAWCETFNSREMEVFHAHVDEWDRFIAAWAQEARWVTVGCRAWPPPGLVPA